MSCVPFVLPWMLRTVPQDPKLFGQLQLRPTDAQADHLPAFYWAAFALSGDWR